MWENKLKIYKLKVGIEGTVKIDDFAKEPFLPDEYYQKIDNYLAKATTARDNYCCKLTLLGFT
ncbi:hypothetical protein [Paenibacillus sp. NAIST15-1]|uniref:hypothetical protein n=1 Tax=Paenibacillus sp. NAIST15-1 TaxID=1605994 RepID=UPI0008693DE2|nr:hypothetical protein [Paenibacillus sp. NAIST15-1]GAV13713.1 hypothetical protein PBN151_3650 [Paenibacillus sp. NAIST15-1]